MALGLRSRLAIGMALSALCACGGSGGGGEPANVNGYLSSLPSWPEYSPLRQSGKVVVPLTEADCPGGAVSSGSCRRTTTENALPVYDGDGNFVGYQEQDYTCTTTRYTFTETPQKLVMFSPDVELLWPGALIQGRSLRDGTGLLGLPIGERSSIKVSIPALANDDNYRVVETPDLAEVNQAIGSMIGAATESNLKTPSTISFSMETYDAESEFALTIGMSAKYMGFSGKASASVDRSSAERTVAVVLYQKMFEVVVEPPQAPGAFFNADFTPAVLQQQVRLGRLGPDNLPVYVSNVVYGRIMMFTLTSSASETEIKAALSAAYRGMGSFEGEMNLDARYKDLLKHSKIVISSMGGDAAATEAMIASGDWRSYFYRRVCPDPEKPTECAYTPNQAPLTSAAPLSYTFRNLSDGSIAKVSEATDYDAHECTPVNPTAEFILTDFDVDFTPTTPTATILDGWSTYGPNLQALGWAYDSVCRFKSCLVQTNIANNAPYWYFKAPDRYLGNKLDWYNGELSYWSAAGANTAVNPLWGPPYYDVILKGGPTSSQLTLTWMHPAVDDPPRVPGSNAPAKYVVPLSNELCTGTTSTSSGPPGAPSLPYVAGCWLVAGETRASPSEIQYVLRDLVSLEIRGKYLWVVSPSINTHTGTSLDEVKLSKPTGRN